MVYRYILQKFPEIDPKCEVLQPKTMKMPGGKSKNLRKTTIYVLGVVALPENAFPFATGNFLNSNRNFWYNAKAASVAPKTD